MNVSNIYGVFEMQGLSFKDKYWGINLIESKLSRELSLRRLIFKNGHYEQSFTFAIQSRFKLKKRNHKI